MKEIMQEWNVVVTVHNFKRACDMLVAFGRVHRTDFYNTLVMKAQNVHQMLETLRERSLENHEFLTFLSRLIPVTSTFIFQSPEEFENKSKEITLAWVDELASKGFHVRMHRRGFKGRLSSHEEERFLDDILLEALRKAGTPGHITFENPDAIIAVETITNWAGLSLWTREQLQRYPFIRFN
jgi:tRNA(Ser,Leu) C12 N-acetylase TAN1